MKDKDGEDVKIYRVIWPRFGALKMLAPDEEPEQNAKMIREWLEEDLRPFADDLDQMTGDEIREFCSRVEVQELSAAEEEQLSAERIALLNIGWKGR